MFHCSVFLFSEGVEKCIPWNQNLTQQIDLAFNIFFMVYFFIRVSFSNDELLLKQLAPQADNLLLKGPGFGKASGFKLSNGLDHRLGQVRPVRVIFIQQTSVWRFFAQVRFRSTRKTCQRAKNPRLRILETRAVLLENCFRNGFA